MTAPLLELDGVEAAYEQSILALHGVSLAVAGGAVVTLLGANGAGKSTTLKAIAGLLPAERGAITRGRITFGGRDVTGAAPRARVAAGVVLVPEGRRCFSQLTVEENLVIGALVRRPSRAELRRQLDAVYAQFPRLAERRRGRAGLLSGGEQQMLAIGRALMSTPTLLLLDEPSMGLAPQLVEELFAALAALHRQRGVGLLLAEQNASVALRHADHGYILENGRVVVAGSAAELRARDDVQHFYLGIGARGRESRDDGPQRRSA
jgi:branched-chain amino acid transport system ATP-binding protein